jgi:glycosyltransferase involved in cell wall biosynthesis
MAPEARPTCSIIITCYNYGRYLAEAIESALAQTLPADEIIIVDDGSTDDSLNVARGYADRPGVQIITQSNQGAVAACNTGIHASTGDYFLRLDADDHLDPHYLERTVTLLASHPTIGYVYTGHHRFGAYEQAVTAAAFDRKKLALRPYFVGTALMRRAAFDAAGGYSPDMVKAYEDWDLYLTMAERGWLGMALPEVLYHYRQHSGSRNAMSIRRWLGIMMLLYHRHPSMRTLPLPIFLSRAVLDRSRQRIGAAMVAALDALRAPQGVKQAR